jgi:four helix bundle protein
MKFEDLNAWQKARKLTNAVYGLCRSKPLAMDFDLKDQIQRAAVSANLAEGFECTHATEKLQFWNIARASAGEVRSLLYVISDNKLAADKDVDAIQSLASEVSALSKGLINSYSRKS